YSGAVVGNQIKYFVVAVPNEVNLAANFVASSGPGPSGVELLYSPLGLPTGQSPPDPLAGIPEALTPLVLTPTFPPGVPLPRGKLYYLGVHNVVPAGSNNFTIRAEFNIPVRRLANNPKTALPQRLAPNPYSFADIRRHTELAVTNMNYYYFDIGSTDIVSATI